MIQNEGRLKIITLQLSHNIINTLKLVEIRLCSRVTRYDLSELKRRNTLIVEAALLNVFAI